MAESANTGVWLLIDASGPESIMGLVRDGQWLASERHPGDFLEWHAAATERMLQATGLKLPELSGTIYGSGPGSTLGLRLAAMFIRSLMEIPALGHWECLQYQDMEVALLGGKEDNWQEIVAPWRKDVLHHSTTKDRMARAISHDIIDPADAAAKSIPGVLLGRRPANADQRIEWHPFALEKIPLILKEHPELLSLVRAPVPYTAEDPQFAKWTAKRHSAK
jgi:hypothetical protein